MEATSGQYKKVIELRTNRIIFKNISYILHERSSERCDGRKSEREVEDTRMKIKIVSGKETPVWEKQVWKEGGVAL